MSLWTCGAILKPRTQSWNGKMKPEATSLRPNLGQGEWIFGSRYYYVSGPLLSNILIILKLSFYIVNRDFLHMKSEI